MTENKANSINDIKLNIADENAVFYMASRIKNSKDKEEKDFYIAELKGYLNALETHKIITPTENSRLYAYYKKGLKII